jgi:serine O-acetyltransferase
MGEGGVRPRSEDDRRNEGRPFQADLRKYYRICFRTEAPTARQKLRLWLTHYGFQCVAAYRFDRFARRVRQRSRVLGAACIAVAAALGHAIEFFHHVRIYADIGPGFYIGHVGTIYLGPTTIGRNFSITHNVTVGFGQTEGAEGTPVIGDDVWVGTGSVLSGAIHVDDGVTVANGTMLSRSVGPRSLVAGNPGRVVMQNYDNTSLFAERKSEHPRAAHEAAERACTASVRSAITHPLPAAPEP